MPAPLPTLIPRPLEAAPTAGAPAAPVSVSTVLPTSVLVLPTPLPTPRAAGTPTAVPPTPLPAATPPAIVEMVAVGVPIEPALAPLTASERVVPVEAAAVEAQGGQTSRQGQDFLPIPLALGGVLLLGTLWLAGIGLRRLL